MQYILKGCQDECTNSLKIIQRTRKPPSTATKTKKIPTKLYINEEEEEDEQEEDEQEEVEREDQGEDEDAQEIEQDDEQEDEDERGDEPETTRGNLHNRSEREFDRDKENNCRTFDDTHTTEEHDDGRSVGHVDASANATSNRPSTTVSRNIIYRSHNTQ